MKIIPFEENEMWNGRLLGCIILQLQQDGLKVEKKSNS